MIGHENNWGYKATLKFGEDGATNGDAVELFIRYTGINELVNITVGKQKKPFGLELLTSSKNISLLERSAITDYYTNGPSLGIQVHGIGNNWSYGLGLFESNNKSSASFSHTGFTGRITKAMTLNNQLLVHLGSGSTSRNSYINKKSFTNYNVELAAAYHSFHFQTEYFHTSKASTTFTNHGHYIQFGYIINGIRPYKDGIFKGVNAQNYLGAWELVARYEDGRGKFSDINLGKTQGKQVSAGVNYYLNKHIQIGLSYMVGKSSGAASNNEEYRSRFQFMF